MLFRSVDERGTYEPSRLRSCRSRCHFLRLSRCSTRARRQHPRPGQSAPVGEDAQRDFAREDVVPEDAHCVFYRVGAERGRGGEELGERSEMGARIGNQATPPGCSAPADRRTRGGSANRLASEARLGRIGRRHRCLGDITSVGELRGRDGGPLALDAHALRVDEVAAFVPAVGEHDECAGGEVEVRGFGRVGVEDLGDEPHREAALEEGVRDERDWMESTGGSVCCLFTLGTLMRGLGCGARWGRGKRTH